MAASLANSPAHSLYLIISKAQTGKPAIIYAGMTSRPLKFRLAEHNDRQGKGYTAKRGPWSLLATKAYLSADCALIAERRLKRSRYDKRNWIKKTKRLPTLCHRHGNSNGRRNQNQMETCRR